MLASLSIRDLAVVEALELDVEPGFTVLTGETGAGKSILLTALGLALGERADSGYIRPGSSRAEISLEFILDDAPEARAWLEENELAEDDTCIVRRTISLDGRSRAFVNNRPVTLQALQALSENLVEIHGQHAHLHLLHSGEQRRLLDESLEDRPLLERTASLYRQWQKVRDELEALVHSAKDLTAREELLRYQIEELEQQDIAALDYPALSEEHGRQANVEKILSVVQAQLEQLYEGEQHAVNTLLVSSLHALSELAQYAPEINEITELLSEAQIAIKEAGYLLRRILDKLEADPARLAWLEQRLSGIHQLARKHQISAQDLPRHLERLQIELDGIQHSSERIAELGAELARLAEDYQRVAAQLSAVRKRVAERMQARISETIQALGMPQGRFFINVNTLTGQEPKPYGLDQVEFCINTNPGLPPRPLGKIASGGELSRISLAIQVVATHTKTVPTLIFDEVDAGIGGRVAEIVGQKLRALGQDRQVFCVTHLPQVAAQGHHHLLVEKLSGADKTQSRVRKLASAERQQEIARMLGGIKITKQTLAHAEEMLRWADSPQAVDG
jgi:DNA repair protein RecN (Recombination protein N)